MDNNNDANILSMPKGKKLILEKININVFPEYKKGLKRHFEEPSNYFNNEFGNKIIKIGKLHQSHKRFLTRKLLTKKFRISPSQSNKDISTTSEKFCKIDKKLDKLKKRYINNYEIEEIFNKFKKHNKNINLNLTNQNTFINSTAISKESTNTRNNSNNNKEIKCEIPPNTVKKVDCLKTSDNFLMKTPKKPKNSITNRNIKLFNLKDYIKKVMKKNKTSKYFQLHKNIPSCLLKTSDNIIKRNKLLALQDQYLTSVENNESYKKELKNALASQEITYLFKKEKDQKFSILCNYMSQIMKKPINNLIINNTNDRLKSDIKNRIQNNLDSYFIEKKYSWKNDLRKNNSTQKLLSKLKNDEVIREMKLKECCYSNDEQILKKKQIKRIDYLKERLPKENVDNLVNNINNAFKDYDDLVVNGKNLYKVEYNLCKNIKGRKIISYFDDFIKDEEKNDKLFARNLTYRKIFCKKKK